MSDFRDAVVLNRYIGETRAKVKAQESRLKKLKEAGQEDQEGDRLLQVLRGALAALETRAAQTLQTMK